MSNCKICNYPISDEHHIIPKSWGGDDSLHNKIDLCPNHHRLLHLVMSLDFGLKKENTRNKRKISLILQSVKKDKKFFDYYVNIIEPLLRGIKSENKN